MSRKAINWIYIFLITTIFAVLIIITQVTPNANELIEKYFQIRYDHVNYSNIYKKVDMLSDFYSENLQNSESWLINKNNIDSTYETMKSYGINSELKSIEIKMVEENIYQADIYVLYNTEDVANTHYIYYLMNVELCKENKIFKIDNIDVLEKIPVFTGGFEMDLESIIAEITDLQENHEHNEH